MSTTGGAGVVTIIGIVPALLTELVAEIVNVVAVKYVPCAIVKSPVDESIVTPDVVGEYDHTTVPTSGVLCVNWIDVEAEDTSRV